MTLLVSGSWTYHMRDDLKRLGFKWRPKKKSWEAPHQQAYDIALTNLKPRAPAEWTLTVHGDAGWKEGVGRWAWYARWSGGVREGSHQGECPNVNTAEARSLWFGLADALEHHAPAGNEVRRVLFLRNDNTAVVGALKGKSSFSCRAIREIRMLCRDYDITINAKHVKGHQNKNNSAAAWVNWRCDQMSNLRGVSV